MEAVWEQRGTPLILARQGSIHYHPGSLDRVSFFFCTVQFHNKQPSNGREGSTPNFPEGSHPQTKPRKQRNQFTKAERKSKGKIEGDGRWARSESQGPHAKAQAET